MESKEGKDIQRLAKQFVEYFRELIVRDIIGKLEKYTLLRKKQLDYEDDPCSEQMYSAVFSFRVKKPCRDRILNCCEVIENKEESKYNKEVNVYKMKCIQRIYGLMEGIFFGGQIIPQYCPDKPEEAVQEIQKTELMASFRRLFQRTTTAAIAQLRTFNQTGKLVEIINECLSFLRKSVESKEVENIELNKLKADCYFHLFIEYLFLQAEPEEGDEFFRFFQTIQFVKIEGLDAVHQKLEEIIQNQIVLQWCHQINKDSAEYFNRINYSLLAKSQKFSIPIPTQADTKDHLKAIIGNLCKNSGLYFTRLPNRNAITIEGSIILHDETIYFKAYDSIKLKKKWSLILILLHQICHTKMRTITYHL